MIGIGRALRYAGVGLVVVVLLVAGGFVTGVLGVPTVESVENRFADVDENATTIDTNVTVGNPNPIGVSLGDLGIDYAIAMNGVPMANGSKAGLSVGTGNSTIPLTTTLDNQRIPRWWYTHVDGGETTEVGVDVNVTHSLLGGRSVAVEQEQTIETDILGQFNDSTTRPIDANQPVVSDPVLYLNETAATYGEDVTPEQTPLDLSFTVYNPKPYPYGVSEVGYDVRMNEIAVGEGSSERAYSIPPRSSRTIEATVVIDNERLDDWWVSHLERDQMTDLTVDVYVVVDPDAAGTLGERVPPIRLDSDALDYETTIETDIFGTKATDGLPPADADTEGADGDDDTNGGDESDDTPTETETATDSSGSTPTDSETETATDTETDSTTDTETETETESDGGVLPLN